MVGRCPVEPGDTSPPSHRRRSRAAGLGQVIRVRLADRELSGLFETIDDAGRLVLALPDGDRRTIAAGDVIQLIGPERSPAAGGEA